jgi:hypothetical protein
MELSREDDDRTNKTSTSLKSMEIKRLRLARSLWRLLLTDVRLLPALALDGNKFVTLQKAGEKSTKSIREFNGDEVVQTMTIDGVQ